MYMQIAKHALALFIGLGLLLGGSSARVTTATLHGTVTDPSGANIKVVVALIQQQTGATISMVAGDRNRGHCTRWDFALI